MARSRPKRSALCLRDLTQRPRGSHRIRAGRSPISPFFPARLQSGWWSSVVMAEWQNRKCHGWKMLFPGNLSSSTLDVGFDVCVEVPPSSTFWFATFTALTAAVRVRSCKWLIVSSSTNHLRAPSLQVPVLQRKHRCMFFRACFTTLYHSLHSLPCGAFMLHSGQRGTLAHFGTSNFSQEQHARTAGPAGPAGPAGATGATGQRAGAI